MKHSYRDAKGRFTTAPPPAPKRSTPPQWTDGKFTSRDKWNVKHQQESEFTGRSASVAYTFAEREEAAVLVAAVVSGELDDFLARAFTSISVRPTPDGWAVKLLYCYPKRGEMSP